MYDSRFLDHDAGRGHPERSERLLSTVTWLESRDWFAELVRIHPAMVDPVWIETVHDASYIARAEETCRSGAPFLDVADVGISRRSSDVARLAAGGALAMADRIVAGDVDNGFALSRPPGHHAERGMALGFCLFNNVAIAARYLQRAHGVDKVLILDFDVHHGNGTQHTFEEDPSVMYASIHQYPYYPGTGASSETGTGSGEGYTVNFPLPAGTGDDAYLKIFEQAILPRALEYRPDCVLVSAGFDAHYADPLAHMQVSEAGYRRMTEVVKEIAATCSRNRLISVLEGGYNVEALGHSVTTHVATLRQDP